MAFIKVVGQDEAEGELAEAYEQVAGKRGQVSNVLAVQSLDPKAMLAHLELYRQVMFSTEGLSRREREVLAVAVSKANGCAYCVSHHRAALASHSSEEFAAAVAKGEEHDEMTGREKILIMYAELQTATPLADPQAIISLRIQQLSDLELLQATQVVAYFNFVNRMVLALGVRLEGDDGASGDKH
ncbi:peroxidase-related enzyme [bacterium]|nr:peroxidase-related enzyme [bacterium]